MLTILRTDAGLVAQVMAGRPNRFDELVRRHFNVVYGIPFSYTRNHADAEDLSQEAFLKAYQSLNTLQEPKKFGHWVSVIARNLSRSWYMRRRRESEVLAQVKSEGPDRNEAAYDDMREVLEQQIRALDPIPREVLLLHYFSGQSTAEIAKTMGVSQAAVLKRLQRAREALGVKLIHELKLIPAVEHDSANHRRIIMSAITASGLTWKASGSGWASVAASSLLSGKAIATGVLVASVVTAAVMLNPQPSPSNGGASVAAMAVPISATQGEDASDSEVVAEETQFEVFEFNTGPEAIAEFDIVLTAALEDEPESADQVIEVVDPNEGMPSLEGDWRVYGGETGREDQFQMLGIAKMIREGTRLTIANTGALAAVTAEGEVHGTIVGFELIQKYSDQDEATSLGRLEGDFSGDFDVLVVSGVLDTSDGSAPLENWTLRLERMDASDQSKEQAIEIAREKLSAIQQAVSKYIAESSTVPSSLEVLYPKYLQDESLIAKSDDETLTYFPMPVEYLGVQDRVYDPNANNFVNQHNFIETGDPGYLIDLEEDLMLAWGDYFPGGSTVLRLENETHEFALEAGDGGSLRDAIYGDAATYAQSLTANQKSALRASCANNLKQLGLSFKMYKNESKGEYFPGGFRQIYPEYISDLAVLTCPAGELGLLSYEVVFPATNRHDWMAIEAAVYGIPVEDVDRRTYISRIPIMIEIDECSGSGGRNVLFVDGHVEYVLHDNWNDQIGPYLAY